MLASDEWSQTTEASVIAVFNAKLSEKVAAFKAANEGVSD